MKLVKSKFIILFNGTELSHENAIILLLSLSKQSIHKWIPSSHNVTHTYTSRHWLHMWSKSRRKLLQYNLEEETGGKWPAINGGEAMQMKLHEHEGECVNNGTKEILPREASRDVERNRRVRMAFGLLPAVFTYPSNIIQACFNHISDHN
jgi:hypothetical protein